MDEPTSVDDPERKEAFEDGEKPMEEEPEA